MRNKLAVVAWLLATACAAPAQTAQYQAAQLQNEAASLLLDGQHEAAIVALHAAADHYKTAQEWPSYFSCLNQATNAHLALKNFEAAKELAKKALWESIKELGRDNEESAKAAHQLALAYDAAGRHTRAAEYHEMGLKIRRSIYEDAHPQIIASHLRIAQNLTAQEKYEAAATNCQTALHMGSLLFGDHHTTVADAHAGLAQLMVASKRQKDAVPHLETALAIRQKVSGEQHVSVAQTHTDLANVLMQLDQRPAAEEHQTKAAAIYLYHPQEVTLDAAEALLAHTARLRQQGNLAAAMPYAQRAYQLFKVYQKHGGAAQAAYQYGWLLWQNGQAGAAVAPLERSIRGANQSPLSYRALVLACAEAGDHGRALSWAGRYADEVDSGSPAHLDAQLLWVQTKLTAGEASERVLSEAMDNLTAARGTPLEDEATGLLGQVLLALQRPSEALPHLEEASRMPAQPPTLRQAFAQLSAQLAYLRAAVQLSEQGYGDRRSSIANYMTVAHRQIALILARPLSVCQRVQLDQHQQALTHLILQIAVNRTSSSPMFSIAEAFEAAEDSKAISLELYRNGKGSEQPLPKVWIADQQYWAQWLSGGEAVLPDWPVPSSVEHTVTGTTLEHFMAWLTRHRLPAVVFHYSSEVVYRFDLSATTDPKLTVLPLSEVEQQYLEQWPQLCSTDPRVLSADALSAHFQDFKVQASALRTLLPAWDSPPDDLLIIPHGPLYHLPFEALPLSEQVGGHFGAIPYLGNEVAVLYRYAATTCMEDSPTEAWNLLHAYLPEVGEPLAQPTARAISQEAATAADGWLALARHWTQETNGQLFQSDGWAAPDGRHALLYVSASIPVPTAARLDLAPLNQNKTWLNAVKARSYLPGAHLVANRWETRLPEELGVWSPFLQALLQRGQAPARALLFGRQQYLAAQAHQPLSMHPYFWASTATFAAPGKAEGGTPFKLPKYWIIVAVGGLIVLGMWMRRG